MNNQGPNSKRNITESDKSIAEFLHNSNKIGNNITETVGKQLETDYVLHARKIQDYIAKKTGKEVAKCTFGDLENMDKETFLNDFKPIHINVSHPKGYTMLDPQCEVSITYTDPYTKKEHLFTGFPRIEDNEDAEETGPLQQHLSLYTAQGTLVGGFPIEIKDTKKGQIYELDTKKYTLGKQDNAQTAEQLTTQGVALDAMWDRMKELEYQGSHLSDAEIAPQDNLLGAYANSVQSDPSKQIKPQLPHPDNKDPEDILNEGETIKKSKNKFDNNPFYGFHFKEEKDIPEEVKQSIKQRGVKDTKGRVFQGSVYLNKTYFCKKYGFKDINRKRVEEGNKLVFTMQDGTERSVLSLYREEQYKTCMQEMLATKIHEITHRLLHFHDIHTLDTTTTTGEPITVDQEFLCEVADRISRPREKGGSNNKDEIVKTDDGKTIYCAQLEEEIARIIHGFTRKSIRSMDIKSLEDYLQHCEQFDTLAAANAAALNKNQIKQYNKVRKGHIDNFITKEGPKLDFDNPEQSKKFNDALALQSKIEELQTKIGNRTGDDITDDELTEAQALHQEINDFFKKPQQQGEQGSQGGAPSGQVNPTPDHSSQGEHALENETHEDEENTPSTMKRKAFQEMFVRKLAGKGSDEGVKCTPGTALFLKEKHSTLPGNGYNRVKYEIINVGNESIRLRMEDATDNLVSGSKAFELPMTEDTIDQIQKKGGMETILFTKTTKSNAHSKLQRGAVPERESIDGSYNKKWFDGGKEKNGPITHVGRIRGGGDTSNDVTYAVDFGFNKVTVTGQVFKNDATKNDVVKDQKGNVIKDNSKELRTKSMDYDTFMVFCKTKNLKPLNEEELIKAKINPNPAKIDQADISWKDKFISIGAIRNFLKAIPESIKKKQEEELEFQSALAKTYFANRIPNTSFLNLDEIRNEIGGMDGVVRQKIQKYKGDRAGEKPDSHDEEIFKGIEGAIFENPTNRRNFKYKAASALLYTLEKGSLYPRSLAKYENADGGGYWIKILLGETMQKEYQRQRNALIDQLKTKNIEEQEKIHNDITKLELKFIQEATTDKPFRGSKFGREVESHKDKLYGGASSIDSSSVKAKGNFNEMFNAFKGGGLKGNSPKTLFSALKAMEESIESESDLKTFFSAILLLFVTGTVHKLPNDYRDMLAGIGRAKGFPIALFVNNPKASGDVVRMLDHIGKNAGISSFTHYIGSTQSVFDQKNISNYNIFDDDSSQQQKLVGNFLERWGMADSFVLNAFAPGEDLLKMNDYPNGQPVPEQTKNTIRSYLGKGGIFNPYVAIQGKDYGDNVDPQSPIFQKNLMNLSKGPLTENLGLTGSNVKLQAGASEKTKMMWNNLSDILGQYENTIKTMDTETLQDTMAYLYAKYLHLFGDKLNNNVEGYSSKKQQTFKEKLEKSLIEGDSAIGESVADQGIIVIKPKTKKKPNNATNNPNNDEEDSVEYGKPDIGLSNAKNGVKKFTALLYEGMKGLNQIQRYNVITKGTQYATGSD